MNKADHRFHRSKREDIDAAAQETTGPLFYWREAANRPIYIPKRGKKK